MSRLHQSSLRQALMASIIDCWWSMTDLGWPTAGGTARRNSPGLSDGVGESTVDIRVRMKDCPTQAKPHPRDISVESRRSRLSRDLDRHSRPRHGRDWTGSFKSVESCRRHWHWLSKGEHSLRYPSRDSGQMSRLDCAWRVDFEFSPQAERAEPWGGSVVVDRRALWWKIRI